MTPADLLNLAAGAAVLGLTSLTAALGYGLRTRAARFLSAFFACFALANLLGTALFAGGAWLSADAVRWLRVIEVPIVYLLGPLLYAYAVALTSDGRSLERPGALWHLLPCAIALAISLANALFPFDASPVGRTVFLLSFHAWVLQGVAYLVAAAWRSYHARPLLEQISADEAVLHLGWLRWLIAVIAVCWISNAIDRWLQAGDVSDWTGFGVALCWLSTVAMYLLAWFGLRQRILLPTDAVAADSLPKDSLPKDGVPTDVIPTNVPEPLATEPAAATARYERSGLDPAQCAGIAAELSQLMRTECLYVDPDFDLPRLSQRSGWPPNHVSQALNQGLGQNFFEFVNGFRIAAALTCLADASDRRSVLDIALACGFGSKSTFNTVFKRMTGRTPSEYRRQQGNVTGALASP